MRVVIFSPCGDLDVKLLVTHIPRGDFLPMWRLRELWSC